MLKKNLAITVARELGFSDSDTDNVEDSFLVNYLNWLDEIYLKIVNELDWGFQDYGLFEQATEANNGLLLLNVGILQAKRIQRKDNLTEIKYVERQWLIERRYDFNQTGELVYWAYEGVYEAEGDSSRRQIRLVYVPDSVITLLIEADKVHSEELDDNEHIPFPSNFIPALKHGVRSLAYRNEDQDGKADYYDTQYEREILKLKKKFSSSKSRVILPLPNADLRTAEQDNLGLLRVPDTIET